MKFEVGDIVRAGGETRAYHYRIVKCRSLGGVRECFIEQHSTGHPSQNPVGHGYGWFEERVFLLVKKAYIESAEDMEALYG